MALGTIAFALPANANTLSTGGITLSGSVGSVNYMAYASPGDLEAFINTYGFFTPTSGGSFVLNGYLPMTVSNGSAIGGLFGTNVNVSFSDIDSMPPASTPSGTAAGDPITQLIGGTGNFSLIYQSGSSTYTLTASTAGDEIAGNLGGTTADIDLFLCNFADNDPSATASAVVGLLNSTSSCSASAANHVYIDISGTLTAGTLSEGTCGPGFCSIISPGEQYLNSFDLDYSMTIGTTPPGTGTGTGPSGPSATPEPSGLLMLGTGLFGSAFSFRRIRRLCARANS